MEAASKRQRALEKKARYERLMAGWPIKLTASRSKGRHVVAFRPLSAGTTVLEELPAAFAILKPYMDETCLQCLRPLPDAAVAGDSDDGPTLFGAAQKAAARRELACEECRQQAFYCSRRCREEDFPRHKLECRVLRDLPGTAAANSADYGLMRLVLAVLVRKSLDETGDDTGAESDTQTRQRPTPYACVKDLLSHQLSYKDAWLSAVSAAAADLASQLPPTLTATAAEITTLACQINANSHGIRDPTGNANSDIAVGMFPLVAMLNHSCSPNCAYVGAPYGKMVVRTLRDVKEGEELCVSYVDLYAGREERRGKLLETKFFWCECERCVGRGGTDAQLEGLMCRVCGDGMYVAETEDDTEDIGRYRCDKKSCDCWMTATEFQAEQAAAEAEFESAMDFVKIRDSDGAKPAFERFLVRHGGGDQGEDTRCTRRLHPRHSLLLNARATLVNVFFRLNDFPAAAKYARAVVEGMENGGAVPPNWPETADFWCRLGETEEIVARATEEGILAGGDEGAAKALEAAREAFGRCFEMRRIAYGETHPRTLNARLEYERVLHAVRCLPA
ncbi:hypothetical protein HK104_006062 [Borealophlyctis nickersoniae]|nr:hypothetical protein HK104_006062 [Borealophlyctis nickersoniae]